MRHHNPNIFHAGSAGKYKPLAAALLLAGLAHAGAAQAAIPAGTVLQYTAGYTYCAAFNAKGKCIATDAVATYFSMDTNADGTVQGGEKTPFGPGPDGGVIMGVLQDTNGHLSHSGGPADAAGGLDNEWLFFGNSGMVYTTSPINDNLDDTLDFSGWTVTWNAIPTIPMGGSPGTFPPSDPLHGGKHVGFDTQKAAITCYDTAADRDNNVNPVACAVGKFFRLSHKAHVPLGDPSGFGGVAYTVNMVGTIFDEPPGTEITLAGPNVVPPPDSAMARQCVGGCFDFTQALTTGTWLQIVLPLTEAIPADAVYRKFINGAWQNFTTGAAGTLKSAPGVDNGPGVPATCPGPSDPSYTDALTAGNRCVRLGIPDNLANDADTALGTVADPGGVGVPLANVIDLSSSTVNGCSLTGKPVNPLERGDWWLVAGFLAWLGALIRRKRHS